MTTSTEDTVEHPVFDGRPHAGPRRRFWQLSPERGQTLLVGGLCGLFLLFVVLGLTTSSLGAPMMRQDPADPLGTTVGEPRGIRSDEWQVDTPLLLGLGATGEDSVDSPLSQRPDVLSGVPTSGGFFTSTVNFDSTLLRLGNVVPVESLFAVRWWLPWLLLLLALPVWLRRVGATPPMSWLATGLVAAAPATSWWSYYPIRILGFAAAGCVLGMISASAFERRKWVVGVGAGAVAGLLLARLATWYIPWSLTLAVPLVLATLAWLLFDRGRRRAGLLAIAVTAAVSVPLLGGLYWENWPALMASVDTVYPGQRLSGARPTSLAQLFGAPGASYFQLGREVVGSNVSELSSAFTFCAVWAVVLYATATGTSAHAGSRSLPMPGPRGGASRAMAMPGAGGARRRPRLDRDTLALAVLAAATVVWLVWCTVSLGRLALHVPVLNRVPPERAAQTVGYLAVLVVALMLSRRGPAASWRAPLAAAVACAGVTAYAVSQMQLFAPGITAPLIVGLTVVVFAIVLTITKEPDRWRWTVLAVLVAGLGVAAANPIQIGVGDLRDSESAQAMLAEGAQARDEGTFWATDGADTDTLLMATGVPSLSSIQITGPERDGWEKIDPDGKYEDAWNRGTSSVEMSWLPSGPAVVTAPVPDQILVQADPCELVDNGLPLSHVISRNPLPNECLTAAGTLEWNGSVRYVYETTASAD